MITFLWIFTIAYILSLAVLFAWLVRHQSPSWPSAPSRPDRPKSTDRPGTGPIIGWLVCDPPSNDLEARRRPPTRR